MECKHCGEELQKIPVLGNTRQYSYYCNNCNKMSDEVFKDSGSWRGGLNGHRKTGGVQG